MQPSNCYLPRQVHQPTTPSRHRGPNSPTATLQQVLAAAAGCIEFLSASLSKWETRLANPEIAAVVKSFRMSLKHFQGFHTGCKVPLAQIFSPVVAGHGGFHRDLVDGKFKSEVVVPAVEQQCCAVLELIGKQWSDDIKAIVERMNSWVPSGWQLKRNTLISDIDTCKALLANPHAIAVSQMFTVGITVKHSIQTQGWGPG